MVRVYVDTIREQLQTIANGAIDWQQRDKVDTIVIPIQVGTSWILYMTERTTHNQIAVRITRGFNVANSTASCTALEQLDLLMHNVGRGALDIWLRLLLRDAPLSLIAGRDEVESIREDLSREQFSVNLPTSINAGEVSPG
jgi:hypothetical protein